jgi:hypothetical protein
MEPQRQSGRTLARHQKSTLASSPAELRHQLPTKPSTLSIIELSNPAAISPPRNFPSPFQLLLPMDPCSILFASVTVGTCSLLQVGQQG